MKKNFIGLSDFGPFRNILDFDVKFPIDFKTALTVLGGNKTLFFHVLGRFDSALQRSMENIATLVDKRDFSAIDMNVHILMTSSGTVGAGRLHYACFYLREAYHRNDMEDILQRCYPLVVEASVEVKRYAKKFTAEFHGHEYRE